jgi:hypothetical protein
VVVATIGAGATGVECAAAVVAAVEVGAARVICEAAAADFRVENEAKVVAAGAAGDHVLGIGAVVGRVTSRVKNNVAINAVSCACGERAADSVDGGVNNDLLALANVRVAVVFAAVADAVGGGVGFAFADDAAAVTVVVALCVLWLCYWVGIGLAYLRIFFLCDVVVGYGFKQARRCGGG